jgi:hypothetical protein
MFDGLFNAPSVGVLFTPGIYAVKRAKGDRIHNFYDFPKCLHRLRSDSDSAGLLE